MTNIICTSKNIINESELFMKYKSSYFSLFRFIYTYFISILCLLYDVVF